ncbi:MAG: hypothetical protein ACOZF2_06745 [Thermodesulfobacteriota bacterium]
MLPEEKAITQLSAELAKIYLENVGKEPDPELVREEAKDLVAQYGPITTIKDIFNRD